MRLWLALPMLCIGLSGCSHSVPSTPPPFVEADVIWSLKQSPFFDNETNVTPEVALLRATEVMHGVYLDIVFRTTHFKEADVRRLAWDLPRSPNVNEYFHARDRLGSTLRLIPSEIDARDYVPGIWFTPVSWDYGKVGPRNTIVSIEGETYLVQTFILRYGGNVSDIESICITDRFMTMQAVSGKWGTPCINVERR